MSGVIFDSSVYIDSLRLGDLAILAKRRIYFKDANVLVYLSAVVLQELYSGASDPIAKKLLAKLDRDYTLTRRLLLPNENDWKLTGHVLLSVGEKYGFEMIKRSRMTNDCLMAMNARRLGLAVITKNAKDFRLISEFRPLVIEEV